MVIVKYGVLYPMYNLEFPVLVFVLGLVYLSFGNSGVTFN